MANRQHPPAAPPTTDSRRLTRFTTNGFPITELQRLRPRSSVARPILPVAPYGGLVIEERDVLIPMRDGVRLAADVWRPDTDQPVPVLVSRTPYGRP